MEKEAVFVELTIRAITPDEFGAFARAVSIAFGETGRSPEQIAEDARDFAYDRGFAAFDGDTIVATVDGVSFDLTLPGLTTIPVGGITGVGVLPTHRRRGLLRGLMARELDTIAARGESVAILTASESSIYRRFGFGAATVAATVEIDRRHAAFARPPSSDGTLTLIDHDRATAILPDLYHRARLRQPGAITRSAERWTHYLRSFSQPRDGASPMFVVTYTAPSGVVEGAAWYRIKQQWDGGLSAGTVLLRELVAITPDAEAALWDFCLNIDLTTTVIAQDRPLDEPLRWQLADPRRLRITCLTDDLWVRVLDVPVALAARRYAVRDRLVLAVNDPFRPATAGHYELVGGPDEATCRRTEASPDLTLDIAYLGAAYLGGARFGTLLRAGRIVEHVAGAAQRADLLFFTDPAPRCATPF